MQISGHSLHSVFMYTSWRPGQTVWSQSVPCFSVVRRAVCIGTGYLWWPETAIQPVCLCLRYPGCLPGSAVEVGLSADSSGQRSSSVQICANHTTHVPVGDGLGTAGLVSRTDRLPAAVHLQTATVRTYGSRGTRCRRVEMSARVTAGAFVSDLRRPALSCSA